MLGLDKSPDGKENVYKINIDLQVEKENLLQQVNDLQNNHIEQKDDQVRPIGQFLRVQMSKDHYLNAIDVVKHEIKTEIEM